MREESSYEQERDWSQLIGDPTLADAILDRLVHNAYKLQLKGESMRKKQTQLAAMAKSE